MMADADQDKQMESNFEDDLDKMLQDTAGHITNESTMLDIEEDTIDRLLDANTDSEQTDLSQSDNVDDLVDALLDDTTHTASDMDEFSEPSELSPLQSDATDELLETVGQVEVEKTIEAEVENLADELLNEQEPVAVEPSPTVDEEVSMSEDNIAEIDEFADESDEDFLLADFDITADEEISEEEGSLDAFEPSVEAEKTVSIEEPAEPVVEQSSEAVSEAQVSATQSTTMSNEQNDRILSLENAVADLKSSLNETEAIDKIIKSQKKFAQNTEETTAKVKKFSVSALIIGLLALIIGITVLVLNLGVQSHLDEVQNTLLDIEDSLAVPLINPATKKIEQVQEHVARLEAEVKALQDQLTELSSQRIQENEQELAQFKEITEGKLSQLSEKISVLEKKTQRVARKSHYRSVKPKEWVVNLVSFKQRWYTEQKVAEFKKKGIPAEIVPITVKGTQWYRVRVVGFVSKAAANSYAFKMKKSLNLNSVWVSGK